MSATTESLDPTLATSRRRLLLLLAAWLLIHAIAFRLGWALGGNDFSSTGVERSLRNLFYGTFIGLGQWLVLRTIPALQGPRTRWLPLATGLGFAIGVLVGTQLVPLLPKLPVGVRGAWYGVTIGGSVVIAQWLCLRPRLSDLGTRLAVRWCASHWVGWLLVEIASPTLGYWGLRIAVVGGILAVSTAPVLATLAARPPPRR